MLNARLATALVLLAGFVMAALWLPNRWWAALMLAAGFTERDLAPYLALNYASEPDLFIRTGGEQRISNFVLWQLAYTELYFTDTLWPDFDAAALDRAIISYQQRERRFGRTSEQLPADSALADFRVGSTRSGE